MRVLKIPTQEEGNPLYPLPNDYTRLTEEGKRLARVNACRQWLLTGTDEQPDPPHIIAERLVRSVHFFDLNYLWPDGDFDPGFYDMPPLLSPPFHWDLVRDWGGGDLNVALAPRGGAKSSLVRKVALLRMVSSPRYSIVYATSTNSNAQYTGGILRDQSYTNQRIVDDFGPEFGGMRPTRGTQSTGVEQFVLRNGSWCRVVSVESRIRGLRPRRFLLDDPEYDEKASTSMEQIRSYMSRLVFNVALPMTMRAQTGIDWVGTYVSKRHFLFHALQLYQTPDGQFTAVDPRFNLWNRRWIRACYRDETTGKIQSIWPQMWPADDEERSRLKIRHAKTLIEVEARMGSNAFRHEMMGEPGSSDEQFFKMDQDPYGNNAWWIEGADDALSETPRASSATMCWKQKKTGQIVRMPIAEFLAKAYLFQTVDTAFTETATSDRRVCCLMALLPDNELFVLDLWSSRKGDGVLVEQSLRMAAKWIVPVIHVEVVKQSFKLYQRFLSTVQTRMVQELGFSHAPAIKDLRPGTMDKTSKIAALDIRFEHGLIKFPVFRRVDGGAWQRLFNQIEGFNPEASDGGLETDDEIDCCAMSLFIIKGRRRRQDKLAVATSLDALDEIRKGHTTIKGTDVPHSVPLHLVDPSMVFELLHSQPKPKGKIPII